MKKLVLILLLCSWSVVDFATTYYSKPSATPLDATVLSNWTSNSGGTGTVPGSFGGTNTWVVQTAGGLTTSVGWVLAGVLDVNKTLTISVTPTITGTITISSTGSLVMNTGGNITLGGNIANSGILTVSSGTTIDFGTSFVLSGTGTLTLVGTIKTSNTTLIPLSGSNFGGTVVYANASGGQHIVAGTYNSLVIGNTSGTSTIGTTGGNLVVTSSFTTTSNGTFDMGIKTLDVSSASVTNNGTLQTETTSTTPFSSGKTWGGTVVYGVTGGTLTVVGGTYNNLNVLSYANASGNISVSGILTVGSSGNFFMGTTNILGGSFSTIRNSGTIRTSVPTSVSSTPLPSGLDWSASGGTVQYFASTGTQTVVAGTYNNITLSGTSGTLNTAGGNIVLNGTLRMTTGGNFDLGTSTLTGSGSCFAGNIGLLLTQSTLTTPIVSGICGNSAVSYNNASGGQHIVAGNYKSLYIANTSGVSTLSGDVSIANVLNLGAGSTLANAGHSISCSGQIYGTGTETGTGVITMAPYVADSSLERFDGATLSNLTLTNGVYPGLRDSLIGNLTITGTLTLSGQSLKLGAANLSMATGSTLAGSFSSSNMIICNNATNTLNLFTNGTGSLTFPIGDANGNYTPVVLNMTGGSYSAGSAYVGMNVVPAKSPNNVNSTDYLNRYWNIVTTNITSPTYNITSAQYVPGDVVGTEANIDGGNYPGSLPWTGLSGVNTGAHTFALSGLSGTSGVLSGLTASPPSVTLSGSSFTVCASIVTDNAAVSVSSSTGDPVLTYTWAPSTGLSVTTGTSVLAKPSTTTVYTCTVTDGNGVTATATVTVNVLADPFAGTYLYWAGTYYPAPSVAGCIGDDVKFFTDGDAGAWSTTTFDAAIVENDGGGGFQEIGPGTATVTYTVSNSCGSAFMTATINVMPAPDAGTISGSTSECIGGMIALSSTQSGGTWTSSSSNATASDSLVYGEIIGVTAGSAVISYTVSSVCGTSATATYTVNVLANPNAGSISGATDLCVGITSNYTDATGDPGGVWATSDGSIATIGSSSGILTTVGAGTVTVSYTSTTTCGSSTSTFNVTVVNLATVTGSSNVCQGLTTALADATGSYSWQSSNTGVATVDAGGTVTGVAAGTATIDYYISGTTCQATKAFTVNALPVATFTATPTNNICNPLSVTYSTQGGQSGYAWTLPGSLGTTYSISAGGVTSTDNTVTLQWLTTGAKTVTVNYTDANSCTATSAATTTSTVNTAPTISFTSPPSGNICSATNEVYTTQAGESNYTWSVPGVLNADYNIISGGVGTGSNTVTLSWLTSGSKTVTVNYTDANSCSGQSNATSTATVNLRPVATFTATPTSNICNPLSVTYSTQGGQSGYAWTLPGSLGTTYSISAGGVTSTDNTVTLQWLTTGAKTVTVNYNDANGCASTSAATTTSTVNTAPTISFTSAPSGNICAFSDQVYTTQSGKSNYIWTVPGVLNTDYTISSGNTGTGSNTVTINWSNAATRTVTVNYTDGNSCTGQSNATSIATVNVRPAVTFTATPTSNICNPLNVTYSTQSGWFSYVWSVPGTQSVDYNIITGGIGSTDNTVTLQWLTTGAKTVTINYSSASGCNALSAATTTSTVNTAPTVSFNAAPSGSICSSTDETYTTQSGQSNYTWSVPGTLNTDYTVSSGGTGTGSNTVTLKWLTSGSKTVTVNYTNSSACTGQSVATSIATVNIRPTATFTAGPTGTSCSTFGYTYTTQSGQSSYTWSVPGVAGTDYTITSGGISSTDNTVTLDWTGTSGSKTVTVNYSDSHGCTSTSNASNTTSLNPLPASIMGTVQFCTSKTSTLGDATTGGTWSISNTSLGTIDATTGVLTANNAGTSTVTYQLTATGCYKTIGTTFKQQPGSISGTMSICPGSASSLSDANTGGTWTSGTTSVTTINAATGVATAISNGTSTINYNLSGCSVTKVFTVSGASAPAAITGNSAFCIPGTMSLADVTPSGSWGIDNSSIATIDVSSGVVTGVANGNANVSYTVGSCFVTTVVTINTTPASISGSSTLCTGSNIMTLIDATPSGTWSSSNTAVATVNSSGVVTGLTAGSVNISYTASCSTFLAVTVSTNPITTNISFSGAAYGGICLFSSSTCSNSPSGGTWSSGTTSIATVNAATGALTSLTTGTAVITYTKSGCYKTTSIAIGAASLNPISGLNTVCTSTPVTLTVPQSGGGWSASSGGHASVSNGVVTGLSAGTATITYNRTSCISTFLITVNSCRIGANGEEQVVDDGDENLYTLYPNPTSGRFSIIQQTSVDKVEQIQIINYLGDLIYDGEIAFTSGKGEMDLGTITSGVYFVVLKDGERRLNFRVVVDK